jgi:hypothetical protein
MYTCTLFCTTMPRISPAPVSISTICTTVGQQYILYIHHRPNHFTTTLFTAPF